MFKKSKKATTITALVVAVVVMVVVVVVHVVMPVAVVAVVVVVIAASEPVVLGWLICNKWAITFWNNSWCNELEQELTLVNLFKL